MNAYTAFLLSWLTFHGYPVVQRDAVYYAARSESGVRANAISPSGHAGLFQLDGPRKSALVAYAKERGRSWTSMQMQLEFMDREWRRMPASRDFFAAVDRATAARLFCRHYEGSIC